MIELAVVSNVEVSMILLSNKRFRRLAEELLVDISCTLLQSATYALRNWKARRLQRANHHYLTYGDDETTWGLLGDIYTLKSLK